MGCASKRFPSSPEADFRTRPIVGDYNDMIYLWVISHLQPESAGSPEELSKKQEWKRRLDEFKQKYAADPAAPEKYTNILRITYNSLPDFLHIADLTYGDMFNMIHKKSKQNPKAKTKTVPFDFPNPQIEHFAKSCEQLSLNKRMILEEFVRNISSPSVRELTDWQGKLTVRVLYGCGLKASKKASEIRTRLKKDEDRRTITSGNSGYFESIKLSDLPILAHDYGLSIHWFLQLDDSVHIYSHKQYVDTILDYYCFLNQKYQDCLQQVVDDLLKGGD